MANSSLRTKSPPRNTPSARDLTDQRFGRLQALRRGPNTQYDHTSWLCRCDCGAKRYVATQSLTRGRTRSCGCWQRETLARRHALLRDQSNDRIPVGMRFGRLTVIGPAEPGPSHHTQWKCQCDCGNITHPQAHRLQSGNTKSCGCLRKDAAKKQFRRHGDASRSNRSALYTCWQSIKQRCLDPKHHNFSRYGGRGILMTPEWANDFAAFRDYVNQNLGPKPSPHHSIDRISNEEGYWPENIRWATRSEQRHNRRDSEIYTSLTKVMLDCLAKLRSKPNKRHVEHPANIASRKQAKK
jgi:hypothetical protein